MRGRLFRGLALALGIACVLMTGAVLANRTDVARKANPEAALTTSSSNGSERQSRAGQPVVTERTVTCKTPIPFKVERKVTTDLRPGLSVVTSPGKEGSVSRTYRITYANGKETARTLVSEQVLALPQNRLVSVGYSRPASRGLFDGRAVRRVLQMHATAYDPGPRSCGRSADGCTATGLRAGKGVVAVDPRVIRLGTRLYVENYGHAIAGDTGRAIKGHRIDLGFDTYREARRFGRRHVTVHVLK